MPNTAHHQIVKWSKSRIHEVTSSTLNPARTERLTHLPQLTFHPGIKPRIIPDNYNTWTNWTIPCWTTVNSFSSEFPDGSWQILIISLWHLYNNTLAQIDHPHLGHKWTVGICFLTTPLSIYPHSVYPDPVQSVGICSKLARSCAIDCSGVGGEAKWFNNWFKGSADKLAEFKGIFQYVL